LGVLFYPVLGLLRVLFFGCHLRSMTQLHRQCELGTR
jgi:hypothetical protein